MNVIKQLKRNVGIMRIEKSVEMYKQKNIQILDKIDRDTTILFLGNGLMGDDQRTLTLEKIT